VRGLRTQLKNSISQSKLRIPQTKIEKNSHQKDQGRKDDFESDF
jgi:hypothetical protein